MEGRGENGMKRTANRGFASMDREQQRAIARKGGLAVSQNRQHMAEIGRKGGESSGESRSRRNTANADQGMNREMTREQNVNSSAETVQGE
ncbi:MAG TPA: KGG domain-containing protein [Chryseosolibacter sp.]